MYRLSVLQRFLRLLPSKLLWERPRVAAPDSRHKPDGTDDATTGDVPSTYLAFLLVLIFAATSCAEVTTLDLTNSATPLPEPALPAGCDPFNPPAWGVAPPANARNSRSGPAPARPTRSSP